MLVLFCGCLEIFLLSPSCTNNKRLYHELYCSAATCAYCTKLIEKNVHHSGTKFTLRKFWVCEIFLKVHSILRLKPSLQLAWCSTATCSTEPRSFPSSMLYCESYEISCFLSFDNSITGTSSLKIWVRGSSSVDLSSDVSLTWTIGRPLGDTLGQPSHWS